MESFFSTVISNRSLGFHEKQRNLHAIDSKFHVPNARGVPAWKACQEFRANILFVKYASLWLLDRHCHCLIVTNFSDIKTLTLDREGFSSVQSRAKLFEAWLVLNQMKYNSSLYVLISRDFNSA